ncbi:hypothetical protein GJ496_008501 [Pomphorhynchus laevis]|nr:hypothetical protein GJ496_008501 [Pomphorhynchus laevis]
MPQKAVTQLKRKCQEYDNILSQNGEHCAIDVESVGNIQSAKRQTRLLLSKKMRQFDSLCQANISGPMDPSEHTTTNEDLAGYWDMVRIQIDKCLNVFNCVD